MPKLRIVVACEKIINDVDGPVSVIGIFQAMRIQLTGSPLPERALSPLMWNVFTMWDNLPEEVGQEFTQIVRMYAPDGTLFMEQQTSFTNNDVEDMQHKVGLRVYGMPIWTEGIASVKVWLKGNDEEMGEFRFRVLYDHQSEGLNAQSPAS